jgi:hypothetical protein
MRVATAVLSSITFCLFLSTVASAQDMPPTPKPGPEHQMFTMDEGTWDAVIEMTPPGGGPATTSKGMQTDTVGCGGLCLITDFKGEFMPGMAFHGHGLTAYDAAKKKYVGSWTDSMSTGLMTSESTYDPATKSLTGWMEGPDMTGAAQKSKSTSTFADADHKSMTMFMTGPDGKETQMMKISYTRRK